MHKQLLKRCLDVRISEIHILPKKNAHCEIGDGQMIDLTEFRRLVLH